MKKPVISLIVLLIVSALCVTLIAISVNAKCNDVTITEEVLYGDKSLADGYTVTTRYQYNNQLFWETEYNMNGEYSTDYSYYNSKQYAQKNSNYQGVDIPSNIEYGFSTDIPAEDQKGISRAFKEMYDSIGNNESTERTVTLADYYEYYPFTVHIDLPGVRWSATAYSDLEKYGYSAEKQVYDRFYEFFKIPVAKGDKITISVGKDMGGLSMGMEENCYSLGLSINRDAKTYTDTSVYFPINNRFFDPKSGVLGGYIDPSGIEGGYGVYSIDYKKAVDESDCGVIPSSLKTVLPLDIKETVVYLCVDNSSQNLIVITSNNAKSYIYVVNTKSTEIINKYELNYGIDWVACIQRENYIVFGVNGGKRVLVLENADNGYSLALDVENTYYHLNCYTDIYKSSAVYYEDGVLAVADSIFDVYGYENCGCYFALLNNDGLMYYANYRNSIDNGNWPDNFNYNCMPADTENIIISKK